MGSVYHTELQTDQTTITALSRAIYNCYGGKTKRTIVLISLLLAAAGFFLGIQKTAGIILIALACLLLSQIPYPAMYRARQVIQALGGRYPFLEYTFYADHFEMRIKDETQSYGYDGIRMLYREKGYLYLFPNENEAFMLDPKALDPEEPERFQEQLSEWTGLKWEAYRPLLFQRMPTMFRSRIGTR